MSKLAEKLDSLHIGPQRRLQLVAAASTFMQNNHECVIAWNVQEQGLIRPIKNLVTNSWIFGTFKVGQVYRFVILDSNPSEAIWPHKSEDTIVQINPVPVSTVSTPPVPVRYTESEMYNMLFGSSVGSVFSAFAPGGIHERKYIIEGTECPSVGILQCNLGDIMMFKNPFNMSATRCRIEIADQVVCLPCDSTEPRCIINELKKKVCKHTSAGSSWFSKTTCWHRR